MTTDKKTLADVKPGGMVRLGDQAAISAKCIASRGDSRWVTQTKFYDPNQPLEVCTGNCTEAALASLFGIGLDEVPSMQGLAGGDYWESVETFVRSRGYALSMPPPSHYPAGLYLADGPSERGCGHFVVMRDGKMVHDPHPSRAGLLNVEHLWSLTALDPAALSAQPSPGGQGALVTDAMVYAAEAAYANSKPDNLHESFRVAIAAALAARQPVGQIPAGFVLVPEKFGIPAEVWEGVEFVIGGPGTGEGEAYLDSTAWVGDLIQDDGSAVYGLHLSCDECPEEGSVTLSVFTARAEVQP